MVDRYSRQIAYEKIGKEGQAKIRKASAAIVGVGALGSVSSELLARAGIGKLILIDDDVVDVTNLQRQALYDEDDVRRKKVSALKKHLSKINSEVIIETLELRVDYKNINQIKADIIIDGTDNMDSRFLLNEYCKKNNIPFIYGSAAGAIGVVFSVLDDGFCFNCIFKNAKRFLDCNNTGVINSATHMVGSLQVSEALKIIVTGRSSEKMIRFDLWNNSFDYISIKKDEKCDVCNGKYKNLEGKENSLFTINECKTKSSFVCKPKSRVKLDILKISKEFDTIENAGIICVLKIEGEEVIVHDYGEILFKTLKDSDKIDKIAKRIYSFGLIK